MSKKQGLILPTLMTLLGISVLCALGYWQLERLEWKRELINLLEKEYASGEQVNSLNPAELKEDFRFRRRSAAGTYHFDKQILVGPKTYESLPGKHVYTPLQLDDGSWLIVNRGWVPQHWTGKDEIKPPQGRINIPGLLRQPERNPFTPDNTPAKEQWYYPDTQQIATEKNISPVHTYVLYDEKADDTTEYPLAVTNRPTFENNHLQYAIFWFTMAGILGIIYILRFLRK